MTFATILWFLSGLLWQHDLWKLIQQFPGNKCVLCRMEGGRLHIYLLNLSFWLQVFQPLLRLQWLIENHTQKNFSSHAGVLTVTNCSFTTIVFCQWSSSWMLFLFFFSSSTYILPVVVLFNRNVLACSWCTCLYLKFHSQISFVKIVTLLNFFTILIAVIYFYV